MCLTSENYLLRAILSIQFSGFFSGFPTDELPLYILWITASIAGVGISATLGMETSSEPYAFLLLPAALGCFALSAVMSWLIFGILHLSLRQRRNDWKSKIR